jgi:hypothetical protein
MLKQSFIFPAAVYKALPFFYLALGALVAELLESPIKYGPAILFVIAGIQVLLWRWAKRPVETSRAPQAARHKPGH